METIEYLECLYNTLRDAKKEKYDYRDYKWVLGYKVFGEIYKHIYPQYVSINSKPMFLFNIEIEIDRINPYTLKLYEDITNKISIPYVEETDNLCDSNPFNDKRFWGSNNDKENCN